MTECKSITEKSSYHAMPVRAVITNRFILALKMALTGEIITYVDDRYLSEEGKEVFREVW